MDACADALCRTRERLEINVPGQVGRSWIGQRIGEDVGANSLQGLADLACDVPEVNHQRGAANTRHPPADLESHLVGAPLEYRADRRLSHLPRQCRLEVRDRFGGET